MKDIKDYLFESSNAFAGEFRKGTDVILCTCKDWPSEMLKHNMKYQITNVEAAKIEKFSGSSKTSFIYCNSLRFECADNNPHGFDAILDKNYKDQSSLDCIVVFKKETLKKLLKNDGVTYSDNDGYIVTNEFDFSKINRDELNEMLK